MHGQQRKVKRGAKVRYTNLKIKVFFIFLLDVCIFTYNSTHTHTPEKRTGDINLSLSLFFFFFGAMHHRVSRRINSLRTDHAQSLILHMQKSAGRFPMKSAGAAQHHNSFAKRIIATCRARRTRNAARKADTFQEEVRCAGTLKIDGGWEREGER